VCGKPDLLDHLAASNVWDCPALPEEVIGQLVRALQGADRILHELEPLDRPEQDRIRLRHSHLDRDRPNGTREHETDTTFACATAFCAWSSVVTTSPLRPQATMPYGAAVGSFLPVKSIEPAW
jgi:hypothetical protein